MVIKLQADNFLTSSLLKSELCRSLHKISSTVKLSGLHLDSTENVNVIKNDENNIQYSNNKVLPFVSYVIL